MSERKIGCGKQEEHTPHQIDDTSTYNLISCAGTVPPSELTEYALTAGVRVETGTAEPFSVDLPLRQMDKRLDMSHPHLNGSAIKLYAGRAIVAAEAAGAFAEPALPVEFPTGEPVIEIQATQQPQQ